MGLFDSLLGGSGSHAQTTTSTSNVTNTQLAGGNIAGQAVYGSGNQVVATDQGTVRAATDISIAALDLGAREAATGSAVAIAGLAHAGQAYTSSLQFAGGVTHDALTGTVDVANNAIANAGGTVQAVTQYAGKALDSVTRFAGASLDSNTYIAGKSLDSTNQAYNAALGTVGTLAQQVTQSGQQATDQTITRVIFAIAAAVALIVIYKK